MGSDSVNALFSPTPSLLSRPVNMRETMGNSIHSMRKSSGRISPMYSTLVTQRFCSGWPQEVGLDPEELKRSLVDGLYRTRIEEGMKEAARYGITAVPTFIINKIHRIVGAQPLESFRDKLRRIQQADE